MLPRADDVSSGRFENPKDVPQSGLSDRKQIDLSTRCCEYLQTWIDESGNKKTGAVVTIQKSGHDMKFVKSHVTLKLVLDQHHGPRHGRLGHAREGVQKRVHQGQVQFFFV